jgi:hypothetical protein
MTACLTAFFKFEKKRRSKKSTHETWCCRHLKRLRAHPLPHILLDTLINENCRSHGAAASIKRQREIANWQIYGPDFLL